MKFKRSPSTYPTKEQLARYCCPECKTHIWTYAGYDRHGERRMMCKCGRTFNKRTGK